ncbi:MAG TPA: hypothetical protein VJ608_06860, partial [Albitalea sp.]|nr:hypothetical protein [Albitalea sp.]
MSNIAKEWCARKVAALAATINPIRATRTNCLDIRPSKARAWQDITRFRYAKNQSSGLTQTDIITPTPMSWQYRSGLLAAAACLLWALGAAPASAQPPRTLTPPDISGEWALQND